jgi:Secretory lipase
VGGPVPAGLGPGDLVAAVDLTPASAASAGFPTAARVWRMLYVFTGIDENDLQLICGTVAAPASGPKLFGTSGRLLNWTHGTVGLSQNCLPSSDPATMFWGKMSGGINAIAWGNFAGKHEGDPAGGLLQYAMNQGMVVAASDYQPTATYLVAKIEASDPLDAARAGTQLMTRTFSGSAPSAYDLFIWGHSQGGQAALWAGQLAQSYYPGMKPSKPAAWLNLVGLAALAPASNFVTLANQPGVQGGDGLADWQMHQNVGLDLPVASLQMRVGPALFSYIFGSWNQLSNGPAPRVGAKFPAFPAGAAKLALGAMVTPRPGSGTVATVQPLCLAGTGAKQIQVAVAPYGDDKTNQMLVPSVWNLPAGYKTGQYFKGGLDRTCARNTNTNTAVGRWCAWMRWNMPGPLGTSPFPRAPLIAGRPVPLLIAPLLIAPLLIAPLLIAQGANDDVIHCIAPGGTPNATVPDPADCMSRALYDSLASAPHCPAGARAGHLEFDIVRKVDLQSPGTHLSIAGEISAKGLSRSASDLVFDGSPPQQFITSAFDRSAPAGCSARVVNPLG